MLPDEWGPFFLKKSGIRDTMNLLTDADSNTNIFLSAGVKKGADNNFFLLPLLPLSPPPKGHFSKENF